MSVDMLFDARRMPVTLEPDWLELETGGDGLWTAGRDGVERIITFNDNKADFIIFQDKVLVYIRSSFGQPAIYPLTQPHFTAPARAVLMDLDGTTVRSEKFWMWIIEQTTAKLLEHPRFELEDSDKVHVTGHSVAEHLSYCIRKYCPDKSIKEARHHYDQLTRYHLKEITEGRGRVEAFEPNPGLEEFLLTLKERKTRIGLVTSGLYEKAWPEILSVFHQLGLGDPCDMYDAIITAGSALRPGQAGTMGELASKPHPWLYSEAASVGLHISAKERRHVIGIEDSAAGVLALRLAGFSVFGLAGGNIEQSGMQPMLYDHHTHLLDILSAIT